MATDIVQTPLVMQVIREADAGTVMFNRNPLGSALQRRWDNYSDERITEELSFLDVQVEMFNDQVWHPKLPPHRTP